MGPDGGATTSDRRVPAPVPVSVFDAFYDDALPQVYGYALRLCAGDADAAWDVTQEAWTALVDHLRDGRSQVMTVGWLVTVARSRFLDGVRREQRLARKLRLVSASERATPADGELSLRHVLEHIDACAPRHRAVLLMAYVDDLPVATIATHLGLSPSRAYAVLDRARAELRAHLAGDDS